jgi:nucleotide-binding universal stress UspA family protein
MGHDNILIATDYSEPAKKATGEAIILAKSFDATIHGVTALEGEIPEWYSGPDSDPPPESKAGQALGDLMSKVADEYTGDAVETAVVHGEPAEAILEYAQDHEIDMIVTGTHSRTGMDRLVIGSIAEQIIRESSVPVVTVRKDCS